MKTTHGPSPFAAIALIATLSALPAQEATSNYGHARARQLAALGRLPSARDIVARDLVNYHRHQLPMPRAGQPVALDLRIDRQPLAPGAEFWLQVGYTARTEGDRSLAPPCAIALVVDCSGSMQERGKMSQVHRGLTALVERLRPDDRIAVVAFADDARVVTSLRPCGDRTWLTQTIAELRAAGSTNLYAGLMRGIDELLAADLADTPRRLLVLTDGIANRGTTDPAAIARATRERCHGRIDVATIGVGDNLDTALLAQLANHNRGLFHFVADERDVQKVFVREAESLVVPVARDVHIELTLAADVELLQCIGHTCTRRSGGHYTIPLPDLNAGATGVVMLRCRTHAHCRGERQLRARLNLITAAAQPAEVAADCAFAVATSAAEDSAHTDLTVRKNAAIAALAAGLEQMARACDRQRWADADRVLRCATVEARHLFPGEDLDVQRVRDIAAGHLRTLERYVRRFHDY